MRLHQKVQIQKCPDFKISKLGDFLLL